MVRAAFLAMESIGWFVIVPLSLAALPTGLVQSLGTEWGLFRHCWMLAKFLYLDDTLTETDATALVALVAGPSLAARFLEATRLNSEVAGLLAAPVPDATMVEFVRADIEKSLVGTQIADGVRLRIAERAQPPAATQPSFCRRARGRAGESPRCARWRGRRCSSFWLHWRGFIFRKAGGPLEKLKWPKCKARFISSMPRARCGSQANRRQSSWANSKPWAQPAASSSS